MDFVENNLFLQIRCEFTVGDFLNGENEAYLVSPAFIPQISLALLVIYNISSPDTALELTIVSRSTEQAMQSHLLPQQQNYLVTIIPRTVEPIYVVLHVYTGMLTAKNPTSSATIIGTFLVQYEHG